MTAHLRSCETGEPFLEEHRLMARDGTIAWFLDEASVVPGATGRRLPTTTARIDISERKPLEYALAHRTKELRRHVAASTAGNGFDVGCLVDPQAHGAILGDGTGPVQILVNRSDEPDPAAPAARGDGDGWDARGTDEPRGGRGGGVRARRARAPRADEEMR